MPKMVRSIVALLIAFLFLGAGCVTTDGSSRGSRHQRNGAPDRTAQEPASQEPSAALRPAEVRPVEMKPSPKIVRWKTVQLGDTPVYATIPEHWQLREDTRFRFSLSARDEGNILVHTVVNEKERLTQATLLKAGIFAARDLPRPLMYVNTANPPDPYKQGNIWYQEATYQYDKLGSGRQVRGLHIMNAKGTVRAHAFMYTTNDDQFAGLRKIAESITFR
jgi:hypothetical protein